MKQEELLDALFSLRDENYRLILLRLIPNIPRESIIGVRTPELRRLAVHDREKGTQYCETLYHYLTCCHSLKQTSDALYTHRNTVLYRIRRLQEDFLIPLEEPSLHADLLLGVSLILFESKGPDFFLRAMKTEA